MLKNVKKLKIIRKVEKYYISLHLIFTHKSHLKLETKDQKPQSNSGPQIYLATDVVVDEELEKLKKIIYLFSCHRRLNGTSSSVLREKLILLLALYLKYGYNKEAKSKAAEILQVKKPAINSMNLELRDREYLIKDIMNTRINHLHGDLEKLREYVNSNDGKPLFFLVQIVDG